jgi:predicted amidophosphoribosyltransferase
MTTCNNLCGVLKAKGKKPTFLKYKNGLKYCSICRVWFEFFRRRCPCCNMKLRTRPRSWSSKKKYREMKIEN